MEDSNHKEEIRAEDSNHKEETRMEDSNHTVKEKITAPLYLLSIEKAYWAWIIAFVCSFGSIIVEFINGDIVETMRRGAGYATCIAIIVPFFIDFIVDYIIINRKGDKEQFSSYKSAIFIASFITLLSLIVLYISKCKSNLVVQCIMIFFVGAVSFYSYLVFKMSNHLVAMDSFKDIPYTEVEANAIKKLSEDAKRINKTTNKDGKEVKL